MSNILLGNMNDTLKNLNSTLKTTNNRLDLLAISSAGDLNNPTTMARLVRSGLGELAYPIGSQITVPHSEYGDLVFNVVAHNWHKNPDDESAPTMTLLMHDTIPGIAFDAAEMLWANTGTTALPAGTYNFTLYYGGFNNWMMLTTDVDGTYQFTTTKDIPVGGGFRHSNLGSRSTTSKAKVTEGTITTYDDSGNTLETNLVVTEGSEGTSLGTASNYKKYCVDTIGVFNAPCRNYSGSNHWGESDVRQWLNSKNAASQWWKQRTPFDLPASCASKAGFLAGFGIDFLYAIGKVQNETTSNEVYEYNTAMNTAYTTEDKMFLRDYDDPNLDDSVNYGYRVCTPFTSQILPLNSSYNYTYDFYQTLTGFSKNENDIAPLCVVY